MNHRLKRVEEAIKRELGEIINRTLTFGDCLPTIHDVSVAPDLRNCHVYLGVLGKGRIAEDVVQKLDHNRPMLQAALSKRVILKYTPHLHFHLDSSVERGVRVLQLLEDIPPFLEEDEPKADEEPRFDTDGPEDDLPDTDLEENEDDIDDDEEDEDDEPIATAPPVKKRPTKPRKNRVEIPEN